MIDEEAGSMQYEFVFWHSHPWDASFDGMRSVVINADNERDAIEEFDRDYRSEHVTLYHINPR